MSDFRLIALALWVTAGCQVYDRVPWHRCWMWLTHRVGDLWRWMFEEGYRASVREADEWGHEPLVVDVSDIESVEFDTAGNEPKLSALEPKPSRRPSRASAAKARKDKP